MKYLFLTIHSTALVLECQKGRGRLWCSFPKASTTAWSHSGELVSVMAIHLILLAIDETYPALQGSIHIYSDCLGALDKVRNLPPARFRANWAHSDVLKNFLVNCRGLMFDRIYSHVKAHQDNTNNYANLSQPSQLNCTMDYHAKTILWDLNLTAQPKQEAFPLEPVSVFVGTAKVTTDRINVLCFWAHKHLARERFSSMKIFDTRAFDMVDWEIAYHSLWEVHKLFQLWACKQVMGAAGSMEWDKTVVCKCPCCLQERDMYAHILFCCHNGRVETLHHTINLIEDWLEASQTKPELEEILLEYARGRGGVTMGSICRGHSEEFHQLAKEQDESGWQRFMEGMVCKQARMIKLLHHFNTGMCVSPEQWASGLVLTLMEATHGQWLYQNVQIHDEVAGTQATLRKEAIQREIEEQLETGGDGLLEEDRWRMEVNLVDLENTSGEQEQYWLVAIKAAREAACLKRQSTIAQQGGS
jgi:hypothetical protein